jgi:hypothetical protein
MRRFMSRKLNFSSKGLLLLAALAATTGCAAVSNPVADAVPARRVPTELLGPSREGCPLPLTLLGQPKPSEYRLAAGDILGVFVAGFLGERGQPLPVQGGGVVMGREQKRIPASTGYPVPVQENGTIDLPVAGSLSVQGLTIAQARDAIRDLYVRKKLIKLDADPVIVNLLEPRQYSVLVLRQESPNFITGPDGFVPSGKRGTGFQVDLPAYENDVLHALTRTGGLPGLDDYNEVVIQRNCFAAPADRVFLMDQLSSAPAQNNPLTTLGLPGQTIHIPLRVPCGQKPCIKLEDVILQTGDVVYLEARVKDVFYTGGLLTPAAHILPRDRDLDVVEAVALTHGPLFNGDFGGSNLSGDLVRPGLGNPSATWLVVVRRTPGGGQVPIGVDLRAAMHNPAERIRVQPGDLLILQEKPEEGLLRWFSETFLNYNLLWQIPHNRFINGVFDISAPDRLTGTRLGFINFPIQ